MQFSGAESSKPKQSNGNIEKESKSVPVVFALWKKGKKVVELGT